MWVFFSLAAAILAALVIILSKVGIGKVDPLIVFGIEAVCMVIITWTIIFAKKIQHQTLLIDKRIWLFLLAAGVFTTFSSLASFHSLKLGHASRTSSFEKISLVFSVLLSVWLLKDKFNWQILVGVVLMVTGVLFIAFSDATKS